MSTMNHVYTGRKSSLLFFLLLTFTTLAFGNTYTVTNNNPAGPGSLDQAIQDANLNPGPDIIDFNIPGTGPFVIAPLNFPGLPVITDAVSINGYTQPGSTIGPMLSRVIQIVVLGGSPTLGFSNGITIDADNVEISGLCIGAFPASGISVSNGRDNIRIWGNFIGMDPTGMASIPNGFNGINFGELDGGGSANNIIGTNSDGTNDNSEGNLISANGQDGIIGFAFTNSTISGNFIGSNRFGTGVFGNLRNGILLVIGSNNNRIGTNGDNVNDLEELNGIINHSGIGVFIGNGSNNNVISGNIIGIDLNTDPAGNGTGIEIRNSSNNRIGVNTADLNFAVESNVVSSNIGDGILIRAETFFGNSDPATGNIVAGNYVGTTPASDVVGNGQHGINLRATAIANTDNVIGSNNDGTNDNAEGNIIANNGVAGLASDNVTDISGNTFSRNSFQNNTSIAIDFGGDGPTPNDDGDGDTGANELYNFPFIISNHGDGVNLRVTGISRPGAFIEVYLADAGGEGAVFLFRAVEGGTLNGITDALAGTSTFMGITDNNFEFVVPLNSIGVPFPPGSVAVAIGTEPTAGNNNTSEFGPAVLLVPVTLTGFKGQLVDGSVKLSWTTTRETNSSHFVIEKSLDGVSYSSIGQVNSGAVNGQYAFTDRSTLGKLNYYRLRMVDADGQAAYSRVLIIRNDSEPVVFKLSPNPVNTYLNVSFKLERDEVIRLNIFDQMGRVTRRYTLQGSRGVNAFTISDLGNLPTGNYVVELVGESISVKQQIIKK